MVGSGSVKLVGSQKVHEASEITVADFPRDGLGLQVVDVREPEEWAEGHIPGSIFMPMGELPIRMGELDPGRPVITVCHSGVRSLYSANALLAAGFSDVRSLAGGMVAWVEEGRPIDF